MDGGNAFGTLAQFPSPFFSLRDCLNLAREWRNKKKKKKSLSDLFSNAGNERRTLAPSADCRAARLPELAASGAACAFGKWGNRAELRPTHSVRQTLKWGYLTQPASLPGCHSSLPVTQSGKRLRDHRRPPGITVRCQNGGDRNEKESLAPPTSSGSNRRVPTIDNFGGPRNIHALTDLIDDS